MKNKERINKNCRTYNQKVRIKLLSLMGGQCVRCGFSDFRALQIDHINGGGTKDIRSDTTGYKIRVMNSFLAGDNKYQLLCANCNWIKRSENNENKK